MNIRSKSSIIRTILMGLIAILVFFIVQTVLVWTTANNIEKEVVQNTSRNTIASAELNDLSILAQQIRRYEKEYFIYVSNVERRNAYQKEWTDTYTKISARLDTMASNPQQAFKEADRSQIAQWRLAADFYASEMGKIFTAVNFRETDIKSQQESLANAAGPTVPTAPTAMVPVVALSPSAIAAAQSAANTAAQQGMTASAPVAATVTMFTPSQTNDMIKAGKDRFSADLIKGVGTMGADKNKATLAIASEASAGFEKLTFGILGTVLVGILIAVFLLYQLPLAVRRPIEALTQSVELMSKGAAAVPVQALGVKEFDGLGLALERMRLSQEAMLQRLRNRAVPSIAMGAADAGSASSAAAG